MKIHSEERRGCRKGPGDWFTGAVWIDEVAAGAAPSQMAVNRVSFEPGARTAWHTHPRGQALYVVSGLGRVQLKGQPVQTIRPGDTIWIDAGEEHWHGAAPGRTMVHLAMQESNQEGIAVTWLDQVSEADYNAPAV